MIIQDKRMHRLVDLDTSNKVSKSICKIIIKLGKNVKAGTGFFLEYKNKKYLITCFHIINLQEDECDIEIWNKKKYCLNLKKHNIKLLDKPKDIAIIEIKYSDEFIDDVHYLDYDLNYIKGYSQYKDIEIFIVGYPKGLNSSADSGTIKKIINFEFYHNIDTETGSSGSPIILFNTLKVIGIHKGSDLNENLNVGTFIDVLLNEIDDIKESENKDKINKIKEEIKEVNVIEIRKLDKYMFTINYKLSDKNYKDLGFLVKIPISNKTSFLTGFLTKYYIEENILINSKVIKIYENLELLEVIDSEDSFIISDEFLNITFIEIKNSMLDYIDIFDDEKIHDKIPINLINYSPEFNISNKSNGKFVEKWGLYIIYQE